MAGVALILTSARTAAKTIQAAIRKAREAGGPVRALLVMDTGAPPALWKSMQELGFIEDLRNPRLEEAAAAPILRQADGLDPSDLHPGDFHRATRLESGRRMEFGLHEVVAAADQLQLAQFHREIRQTADPDQDEHPDDQFQPFFTHVGLPPAPHGQGDATRPARPEALRRR